MINRGYNIYGRESLQKLQYIGTGVPEEAAGKAPRADTPRAGSHVAAVGKNPKGVMQRVDPYLDYLSL
jgi:hypothetical protein